MSKLTKETVLFVALMIINMIISILITNLLGIYNTIIIKTFSLMYGDITWEVIFFFVLSLIEVSVYYLYKYFRVEG